MATITNIADVKMTNGKTVRQNLEIEINRLRDCIQDKLDDYMLREKSNNAMYIRTGKLQNSLKVDLTLVQVVNGVFQMKVEFDESGYHDSGDGIKGWDGNGEKVNTAYLFNYGYTVKKDVWFKNIKNFGWRKPGKFIEDGIAEFNKNNPLGIKVDIIKPNGYLV